MIAINLSNAQGELRPLAPFQVLAVMCHPTDRKMREQMLAPIQLGTAVQRPRRSGLSTNQFMKEAKLRSNRGMLAGGLLLTLLQLQENGIRHSLNRAMPLVTSLLERWEQPVAPTWTADSHVIHKPHSRRKVLDAFNDFLSVAHYWAALIHAGQHDQSDIWPGSNETLPQFLAYADAFGRMGCHLVWPGHDRRYTLNPQTIWHFRIPAHLQRTCDLQALPMTDKQRAILNEHRHG
jgi:hypothetical protein